MDWVRKFINDVQGGFAIWFAVGAMSLAIASGAALDISHAQRAERYLQDLNDNAALAAARDHSLKKKEKKEIAKEFIKEAFDQNYDLHILKVRLKEKKDGTVKVTSVAEINTMMMSMVGKKTLKVKAVSEVSQVTSGGPVEISFIFDVTSSMSFGNKWKDVINEMEDLLKELKKEAGNKQFRVSLVPFSDRVNLGDKKFDYVDMSYLASPAALNAYDGCARPREEKQGGWDYWLTDKTPDELKFIPSTVGTYTSPYVYSVPPCPGEAITYPTRNINKIENSLKKLSAYGTGRFDVGLAWGYRMLSTDWRGDIDSKQTWPNTKNVKKIAVFLTDGYTNANVYEVGGPAGKPYGGLWANLGSQWLFENVEKVCTQMKNDGIQIHIMAVKPHAAAIPHLKNCASDANSYYTIYNANTLIDAIGKIGEETSDLRLVH